MDGWHSSRRLSLQQAPARPEPGGAGSRNLRLAPAATRSNSRPGAVPWPPFKSSAATAQALSTESAGDSGMARGSPGLSGSCSFGRASSSPCGPRTASGCSSRAPSAATRRCGHTVSVSPPFRRRARAAGASMSRWRCGRPWSRCSGSGCPAPARGGPDAFGPAAAAEGNLGKRCFPNPSDSAPCAGSESHPLVIRRAHLPQPKRPRAARPGTPGPGLGWTRNGSPRCWDVGWSGCGVFGEY